MSLPYCTCSKSGGRSIADSHPSCLWPGRFSVAGIILFPPVRRLSTSHPVQDMALSKIHEAFVYYFETGLNGHEVLRQDDGSWCNGGWLLLVTPILFSCGRLADILWLQRPPPPRSPLFFFFFFF